MPYTRTQANALLSTAEMTLFDESRANAVRKLDAKALASRVERTRRLRDKARDQLQRQRLASRSRTGSKRGTSGDANRRSKDKAELLAEILNRFELRARAAGKQARAEAAARKPATKAGAKKTAAKKAAGKKTAAKKTAASRTATKKPAAKKASAGKPANRASATGTAARGKTTTGKAAASRTATRKAPAKQAAARASGTSKPGAGATPAARPAKRAGRKGKAPVSPDQALANTRALLEAKKRHDREGPAWQHLDGAASPAAGRYQSPEARSRAEELHAGESRMPAIEGSISTRGRKNQAKRDKR
jgi:hypothetical protein